MNPNRLVESWVNGRASVGSEGLSIAPKTGIDPSEKLRQAYHWIAQNAIYSLHADIAFGDTLNCGDGRQQIELAKGDSYSSFILLPLLTLATSRRMVIIGAPGRGKTTIATLMALLSGSPLPEVRRHIQHGHPQLTVADLLGSPLPSDLVKAERIKDVQVSWRSWIKQRVKIIDEYNRIPTKTQSSLLSLLSEGYAEMYEQTVVCGPSAWFLTANDDIGGGTFPVIEALRDRIDIAVRCTPFHSRCISSLDARISNAQEAVDFVPSSIVFTDAELEAAGRTIRAIAFPPDVQSVVGFMMGQLDFCLRASDQLEYKNKDTLHLAGKRVSQVCNEDCPLDKNENSCTQTENGVSARTYQTMIHFAKALACFRGRKEVSLDDVRQLLPWILHEKLQPNIASSFFQKQENQALLTDRVSWIRRLLDEAVSQYAAYLPIREPIEELIQQVDAGSLLSPVEVRNLLDRIRRHIEQVLAGQEFNGPVYEDLLLLKSLYSRCQSRLNQLEGKSPADHP